MRLTFDSSADAAYLYFIEWNKSRVHTLPLEGVENGMINIDINSDGIVVGIEFINATALLWKEQLEKAAKI